MFSQDYDYSLWQATRNIKKPIITIPTIRKNDGSWAHCGEERAVVFSEHLAATYQSHETGSILQDVYEILKFLKSPLQLHLLVKHCILIEVQTKIKRLKTGKSAPKYDLITSELLRPGKR